ILKRRQARKNRGGGDDVSPERRLNGVIHGCRLAEYAAAKRLPIDYLLSLGLSEITYQGAPAVKIPYFGTDGAEIVARFRIALNGDRFSWRKGSKACLYGLNRLDDARSAGYAVLVEGESDCHTLWLHGFPALGLPGNRTWAEARD